MTQNELGRADESLPNVTHKRRTLGAATLIGAIGLAIAACVLVYPLLGSFRDVRARKTADNTQMQHVNATAIADETLMRGGRLFESHCQRCHGAFGHGDGPDLTDAWPRPRDLSSASWRRGTDRMAVRRAIDHGTAHKATRALAGAPNSGELESIVDYVLSLETAALVAKIGLSPAGGEIAPPTSFLDANGITGNLEQHRGKVVLIAFWGTTCVPCSRELPELALAAKKFEKAGLVVLPICVDESNAETASAMAASIVPDLRVYVDHDGSVRNAYQIHHLPQSAIIDREGRMLARSAGITTWTSKPMEELFRSLGVDR